MTDPLDSQPGTTAFLRAVEEHRAILAGKTVHHVAPTGEAIKAQYARAVEMIASDWRAWADGWEGRYSAIRGRRSPSIGSRIPPRGTVLRADLELRVAVRRCIRVTKGAIRAFWEAAG